MNITYVRKTGEEIPVRGKVGDNIMYLAHRHDIEMEGMLSFLQNTKSVLLCKNINTWFLLPL